MPCLLILKNAHSTLEWYDDNRENNYPSVNFCVWREPWQRFASAVWTDVIQKQELENPATRNYQTDMLPTLMRDESWLRQQIQGNGQDTLFYNAGHMITQWNNLQRECHRYKITEGQIRIYRSMKIATKTHYNIKAPQVVNQSPQDVIGKIKLALQPFKDKIIEEWLSQDYVIWDQLDPQVNVDAPQFIELPVDKIRKDI